MEQHHLFGNRSSKTYYYNKRAREYANSNNILGQSLSKALYNEAVRDEILSFVKMQIADGISDINSEILTYIISQEIANKIKKQCGE